MTGKPGRSGGKRPVLPHHAKRGRKQIRGFTPRKGERLLHERQTIGPDINERREVWTVLSVSTGEIEFQSGDDIIVIRRPDADE